MPEQADSGPAVSGKMLIAVLPIENLSGAKASVQGIRTAVIEKMKRRGVEVLSDSKLDTFMARNRVRYIGGLNPETAKAFRSQEGVGAVLIISLELYDETPPPKISLFARLVSTSDEPEILWMQGAGLSGDDSPGLLSLGEILDPLKLRNICLAGITDSLINRLSGKEPYAEKAPPGRFRPKVSYRSPVLGVEGTRSIIVVPFLNKSERKNAGELMALQFVEQLTKTGRYRVVEPGVVRQQLLNLRIIMESGLSLADAQALFGVVDADLILTGKVFAYQDYRGAIGTPKVDFSTEVIDKKSREVAWSSDSFNQGTDGVVLFDFGQVNNAHAMASRMAASIVRRMSHG